jgi:SAM-dependent methyltransferase
MHSERRELPKSRVRAGYAQLSEIWPESDPWHRHTSKQLHHAVQRLLKDRIRIGDLVLDVGAGDSEHALDDARVMRLDISEKFLRAETLGLVADAERLPFADASVDHIICVGSVVNYCDPVAAVAQFARVLRPKGLLLLQFESSTSAEYLWRSEYGHATILVTTSYQGRPENLWLYRPSFMRSLLSASGFSLLRDEGVHMLTALLYRLAPNERFATTVAPLDGILGLGRPLRAIACDRLFLAQKQG